VATTLNNLGVVYRALRKYAQAEGLYQRALAIREKALGAGHPYVATTLHNLANVYQAQGNYAQALPFSRKTTAAVIAHAATEAPDAQQKHGADGLIERRANYLLGHVANLAVAARQRIEPEAVLGREALEIAQWAGQSSAAAALAQMAARFAGVGGLGTLIRESQDLSARWRDRDRALIDALAKAEGQQNQATIEALRAEIAEIETRLRANAARLDKEFPDYAALASPKPLKAEEAQKLLGTDEALVFFLTSGKETYAFALTRVGFSWKTIPVVEKALIDKVAALRKSIGDPTSIQRGLARADGAGDTSFDLSFAHELYELLFGPIADLVKDKKHLIVVPSGPLTSLPFHVLVTDKPAGVATRPADAAWLIRRHAITVLPSVASLRALRVLAHANRGAKPLVGFGNPVFQKIPAGAPGGQRVASNSAVRGVSDYFRGTLADPSALRSLAALLDSADELNGMARSLGAGASEIFLGANATESTVKSLSQKGQLAGYRIVAFATHGLVAGDIKGLAEPALALTVPDEPTEADDGLLTASEVARLKLNADWVILSACNTAAGDKPGAEALSGLARAFFYAGARGLLVSHWPVQSAAAVKLTTTAIAELKAHPDIGRAEALRRSMLALMQDKSNPANAHPAIWAPFMMVGEGGAEARP
jgi:CHAT domain-containing protein